MTIEMYRTLNKAKHNTANTHLILAAVTGPICLCGNSRHIRPISTKIGVKRQITIKPPLHNYQIWPESVQCKALWNMPTDGRTAMIKAVDIFAVCANVPKDAVHKQCHGGGRHALWLHLFSNLSHFQVREIPLLTSRMLANTDCPICAQLCCSLLCVTCNRALRHFLLAVCKLLQWFIQCVCCLQQYKSRRRFVYVDLLSNCLNSPDYITSDSMIS